MSLPPPEPAVKSDNPWPVLTFIGGRGGKPCCALMNRKAYRKSIESGVPWIVHPGTGRVLHWPGSPSIRRLTEAPGHFRLELPEDAADQPYGDKPPPNPNPDNRAQVQVTQSPSDAPFDSAQADILTRLNALIAERRETMPSGSYTSLLFESGPSKIRKKLGEEAVELILAQEPADVIYEAADLIYHLQVLLRALDIEWPDIIGELTRRAAEIN